ncbi:hypothetical protein C0Q70_19310 [Pomacea canaliculata]|uniref:Uncharacterized protein n=1 Tax=Pomacea canaliculata TaxID=400727 RepID=A0A2T7NIY9_POMCA|nr:hypothetical protein C0Q70_19310 [Pomacea canaliculata]
MGSSRARKTTLHLRGGATLSAERGGVSSGDNLFLPQGGLEPAIWTCKALQSTIAARGCVATPTGAGTRRKSNFLPVQINPGSQAGPRKEN